MSTYTSPTDVVAGTLAKAAAVNNLDAAVAAAFALLPTEANITRGTVNFGTDAGAADAYVVTLPHVPSGYVDGLLVSFLPAATNTGASTINVNALGVRSIKLPSGADPAAGDLTIGVPVEMRYSTTTGYFHILRSATTVVAAGNGLDVSLASGTYTLSVDLKANGGLVIESTELAVDLGASAITGTLAVSDGGTGVATLAAGGILLGNGTGAVQVLAPGATTEILVGGGAATAPAWGSDIPTAVTIGAAYIYRAGGTDVPVTDGGTGASTLAAGGIVLGNGAGAVNVLAPGATTEILVGGGAGTDPVWTAATGTGAPVRAVGPTITGSMTANIINASAIIVTAFSATSARAGTAATGLLSSTNIIAGDGTDANISIYIRPKGTGYVGIMPSGQTALTALDVRTTATWTIIQARAINDSSHAVVRATGLQADSSSVIAYIKGDPTGLVKIGSDSNHDVQILAAGVLGIVVQDITGSVGIGLTPTANMVGLSVEAGVLTLKETTTPTADANYAKLYSKNDNKLYFQDGAGNEHTVAFV